MKRRDFLRCRSSGGRRIAILSCERLYMAFADSRAGEALADQSGQGGADWWISEPDRQVQLPTVEQLFRNLRAELAGTDVLVLEDRAWLQDSEFERHMDGLLAAVRQQHGEVRVPAGNDGKLHLAEVTAQS